MKVYGNELFIDSGVFDDYSIVKDLADTYLVLKEAGYTACYISTEHYLLIAEILRSSLKYRNKLYFFYSFFHEPYENDEAVIEKENVYYEADWKCRGEACFGLALSYLVDTLSLSMDAKKWQAMVIIQRNGENTEVKNVSSPEHVNYHMNWIESKKKIELIRTDTKWQDKPIHLRDDHGKDVLLEFSRRIIRSPYIISIVNSLEFHPSYRRFILDVSDDGIIKCVLYWTDSGYGIAIQTTARNLRESKEIAKILEDEYT